MKNQFKIILITSITACSILLFQFFWVYRTYEESQENFQVKVKNALQRSVDLFFLEKVRTPTSLSNSDPYLSIISEVTDEKKENLNLKKDFPKSAGSLKIGMQPLKIDSANLESVRLFLVKLIASSNKQSVDLLLVNENFRKELDKEKIFIDYKLSLKKKAVLDSEEVVSIPLGTNEKNWIIEARLFKTGKYLLLKNSIPLAISIILVILTGGSLWYLGLIIYRQKQLDSKKNNFISNITHELRTPISILKSTNEALLQFGEAANPEKTIRYLKINADVLNKLDYNIDRLLDITRYELGVKYVNLNHVNIVELVRSIVNKFQVNDTNQITISTELENETIRTDKDMIDGILTNLIDNALKYSANSAEIVVKVLSTSKYWQLEIQDSGIGISEENLPLIFDKFYRITSGNLHDVKGYGIGLSYVKELVSLLSGEIIVKSDLGSGTTFIIKFPL
ncbi:sensor histidine kinase [Flavobacterium ginsenosidimutans]|uniref:sensor histidine kinase n=1 Tax=Flavobacterium ginsenosidimutans TaxID=687844 RepID=UPI000DADD404|nr:HAMP domain-containing sensor histidine kinase [Flavobacterium ginsenosidimutans]KAF2327751.1 HAMP domain-containing histidine kinase [Flavobacterium ginsenosidimutans]